MKAPFLFLLLASMVVKLSAQSIQVPLHSRYQHFIDRMSILHDLNFCASIKNTDVDMIKNLVYEKMNDLSPKDQEVFIDLLNQYDLTKFTDVENNGPSLIKVDSNFYKYADDNTSYHEVALYKEQRPLLKYFYKNPHHFISVDAPSFSMRVDPIVKLEYGRASQNTETIFQNTRGAELSAMIDDKVFVFARIQENQQGFLPHINQFINTYKAIPQNGFYKIYNSGIIESLKGYDFLNTIGYVSLPVSKSINVELGHGNHFIGNGCRSLLLSEFSNNYFYLKFNTKVWKLHYRNIFAELSGESANFTDGDILLPKKYMASHYLSIKPWRNVELGVFESVIFNRENQFELQYLNPVILYRTVEQFIGSPDNALIGLNASLNIKNRIQIYGQLMLDEFNLNFLKQNGWWGNKVGFQAGLKYLNVLHIDQLDAMIEYNTVRPYSYSHDRPVDRKFALSSYAHYNMPLAHPLGANFKEILGNIKYNGIKNCQIDATISYMRVGRDVDTLNYGQNILLNNTGRVSDFGNSTLQGALNDILYFQLNASYEILTNYKVFLNSVYRRSTSKDAAYNYNYFYLGGGFMINMNFDKNIF